MLPMLLLMSIVAVVLSNLLLQQALRSNVPWRVLLAMFLTGGSAFLCGRLLFEVCKGPPQ